MSKSINVVVASKVGYGKTTVAQIISKALKAYGIKNVVIDDTQITEKFFDERVKAVASNSEVFVKTVCVTRDLTPV